MSEGNKFSREHRRKWTHLFPLVVRDQVWDSLLSPAHDCKWVGAPLKKSRNVTRNQVRRYVLLAPTRPPFHKTIAKHISWPLPNLYNKCYFVTLTGISFSSLILWAVKASDTSTDETKTEAKMNVETKTNDDREWAN